VNYYEHHLGDYAEATAHLSFIEDAAYARCIRKYYASEAPLPAEVKAVQRLIGARSKEERDAVEAILTEFFTLESDGWHNARCDEEIARYQEKRSKARGSANARWNAMRTDSDRNANALPTQCEGNANGMRHAEPSHDERNALQSPVSSLQSESVQPTKLSTHTKRKLKRTIPEDFGLTPERQQYAEKHLPNVDASALMDVFRSSAKAKGWEYADWDQHWQTLVRQWAPNSGHWSTGQYPSRASTPDQYAAAGWKF
jgi:uncharacterized protein YdaU (DUF1376 family)